MTKRKKIVREVKEGQTTMMLTLYAEGRFPREIKEVVTFGLDGKFLVVDALEDTLVRKHVFNMDYYEGYDVLMPPQPTAPTIH